MNRDNFKQFDQFEATELYCAKCKKAVPVRKKLLIILPDGEKFEYFCPFCSSTVGFKMETGIPQETQIII